MTRTRIGSDGVMRDVYPHFDKEGLPARRRDPLDPEWEGAVRPADPKAADSEAADESTRGARSELSRRLDEAAEADARLEPHRAAMEDKLDRTPVSPRPRAADASEGVEAEPVGSSAWTGRRSVRERVIVVRQLAPAVVAELDMLAGQVERRRFNDPETAEALRLLRELHGELGRLIEAIEVEIPEELVASIARKNAALIESVKAGAKIGVVAPALTVGISQMLSLMTGVAVDSTMVSAVWGGLIAAPVVRRLAKK